MEHRLINQFFFTKSQRLGMSAAQDKLLFYPSGQGVGADDAFTCRDDVPSSVTLNL